MKRRIANPVVSNTFIPKDVLVERTMRYWEENRPKPAPDPLDGIPLNEGRVKDSLSSGKYGIPTAPKSNRP